MWLTDAGILFRVAPNSLARPVWVNPAVEEIMDNEQNMWHVSGRRKMLKKFDRIVLREETAGGRGTDRNRNIPLKLPLQKKCVTVWDSSGSG